MKVIYIAGPYRHKDPVGQATNIAIAMKYAKATWAAGYYALCPHLNTQMFDGLADDNVFLEGYIEMVKRCDAVVVLPNHHESEGTMAELAVARENNIPIIQCPDQSNAMDTLTVLMKEVLDAKC